MHSMKITAKAIPLMPWEAMGCLVSRVTGGFGVDLRATTYIDGRRATGTVNDRAIREDGRHIRISKHVAL